MYVITAPSVMQSNCFILSLVCSLELLWVVQLPISQRRMRFHKRTGRLPCEQLHVVQSVFTMPSARSGLRRLLYLWRLHKYGACFYLDFFVPRASLAFWLSTTCSAAAAGVGRMILKAKQLANVNPSTKRAPAPTLGMSGPAPRPRAPMTVAP